MAVKLTGIVATASAFPFGDDWNKSFKAMQQALGQPAWQDAMKQIQAAQAPEWAKSLKQMQDAQAKAFQRAVKPVDVSALVNPPPGIDFSAISKSFTTYQNVEVQEAFKRLSVGSPSERWLEIARQITIPKIPEIDAGSQQAIAALQLELKAVAAPEFGPVAAGDAAAQSAPEAGFDWINLLPRKVQIRLLLVVLAVIASLSQGVASATHNDLPPGLAEFEAAAFTLAVALNEAIGPVDEGAPDED